MKKNGKTLKIIIPTAITIFCISIWLIVSFATPFAKKVVNSIKGFSISLTEKSGVVTENDLSKKDIDYIKNLGLLENEEKIIYFSSQLDRETSGNFFTNKRVASYWKYDKNPKDDYVKSIFYEDIKSITIDYERGLTNSTAILIKTKDGKGDFFIYIDDNKTNEEMFFNTLLSEWEKYKN